MFSKNINTQIYHIILIISVLISNIKSEQCQNSFHCTNSVKNCIQKSKTDADHVYNIYVSPCRNNVLKCNAYDSIIANGESKGYCEVPSRKMRVYNGDNCEDDDDCLHGICIKDRCTGSLENELCDIHENCAIGYACINNKCSKLRRLGESCETSLECEYNKVCYNNSCIDAFSLPDGTEVKNNEIERGELFCKSGGIYKDDKDDYICGIFTNLNETCKDSCYYKLSNKSIINIPENCQCGYNKDRQKYCVLGPGNAIYQKFIEVKKEIFAKDLIKLCHTVERLSDNFCVKFYQIPNLDTKQLLQKYNNAKIEAKEYHRIKNAENCIKEIIFDYDNSTIFPDNPKCPKVTCNNSLPMCFFGNNPLDKNGNGLTVQINMNLCNKDEVCQIDDKYRYSYVSVFNTKQSFGKCVPLKEDFRGRYPGEDCDVDEDCLTKGSDCVKGKCTGKDLNQPCNHTDQCLVGLYCDSVKKKCKRQKKQGEFCQSSFDCLNYLGCYSNRCAKFASLRKGVKVDSVVESKHMDYLRSLFCINGCLSKDKEYCTETNYIGETLKNKPKNSDLVECKFGEECHYTDGYVNFTKRCVCSYSDSGKSYCPLPTKYRFKDWNEKVILFAEELNNNCHSLSRIQCYLNDYVDRIKRKNLLVSKTERAAELEGAAPCTLGFFGGSWYMQSKIWFIMIFIFII